MEQKYDKIDYVLSSNALQRLKPLNYLFIFHISHQWITTKEKVIIPCMSEKTSNTIDFLMLVYRDIGKLETLFFEK